MKCAQNVDASKSCRRRVRRNGFEFVFKVARDEVVNLEGSQGRDVE
jgi:hypothetical protein